MSHYSSSCCEIALDYPPMDHIALVSLFARPGSESQTVLDVSVDSTEVDCLDTFDVLAAGIGWDFLLSRRPRPCHGATYMGAR